MSETYMYLTNSASTLSMIYANTAQASIRKADISIFNSCPNCKWQISLIGWTHLLMPEKDIGYQVTCNQSQCAKFEDVTSILVCSSNFEYFWSLTDPGNFFYFHCMEKEHCEHYSKHHFLWSTENNMSLKWHKDVQIMTVFVFCVNCPFKNLVEFSWQLYICLLRGNFSHCLHPLLSFSLGLSLGLCTCFWQGALSCANSVSLWRSALMQQTGTQACTTETHALSLSPLLFHLSLFHRSLAPLIQSFPTLFSINIFLSHVFQAVLFKQFTPLTFGLTQTKIYRLTLPGSESDANTKYRL